MDCNDGEVNEQPPSRGNPKQIKLAVRARFWKLGSLRKSVPFCTGGQVLERKLSRCPFCEFWVCPGLPRGSLRCVFENGGWNHVHKTHKTSVCGGGCEFCVCIFYRPLEKRPIENATRTPKTRTQKTQKYLLLIFVFFVYVFSTSRLKNDLSKMLPRASKSLRKKRKNQGRHFALFAYTFRTSRSKNTSPEQRSSPLVRWSLGELQGPNRQTEMLVWATYTPNAKGMDVRSGSRCLTSSLSLETRPRILIKRTIIKFLLPYLSIDPLAR